MNYKSSLIGFHNPYKHKGMTAEQFLKAWVKSQQKSFKKKDGYQRARLVDWVLEHWDDQIKLVKRLFPNTIKGGVPKKKKYKNTENATLQLKRNAFKMKLPKYRQATIKTWEIDKYLRQLGEI